MLWLYNLFLSAGDMNWWGWRERKKNPPQETFVHSRLLGIDAICLWSESITPPPPLLKSSVTSAVILKRVIRSGILKHPVLTSSLVWRKTPFCVINSTLLPDGAAAASPPAGPGTSERDWAFTPCSAPLLLAWFWKPKGRSVWKTLVRCDVTALATLPQSEPLVFLFLLPIVTTERTFSILFLACHHPQRCPFVSPC